MSSGPVGERLVPVETLRLHGPRFEVENAQLERLRAVFDLFRAEPLARGIWLVGRSSSEDAVHVRSSMQAIASALETHGVPSEMIHPQLDTDPEAGEAVVRIAFGCPVAVRRW